MQCKTNCQREQFSEKVGTCLFPWNVLQSLLVHELEPKKMGIWLRRVDKT